MFEMQSLRSLGPLPQLYNPDQEKEKKNFTKSYRTYKNVRGRLVLTESKNKPMPDSTEVQGATAIKVDDFNSPPSLRGSGISSKFTTEDSDDSEDFDSQKRRLSHYIKTNQYEQSRLRELQVTIEVELQKKFYDLLICHAIFQYLGPLSQEDYEWIEYQAAKDYFVNELRGAQYKTFVRYLLLHDIPPLEVDSKQWDDEKGRSFFTVIVFPLFGILTLPITLLRAFYESFTAFKNMWSIKFTTYSCPSKILLVVLSPLICALWVTGTVILSIILVLLRAIYLPLDICTGWRHLCSEHQWAEWISSVHSRTYCMRYIFDFFFYSPPLIE